MFIRTAKALLPVFLLVAYPATIAAQDSSALLQQLRQTLGGELPGAIHVKASGSGYVPPATKDGTHQTYWIKSYEQDADLSGLSITERVVRVDDRKTGDSRTENRTAKATGSWADQVAFWTTPHGFVAGAASHPITVTSETLLGNTYQVISFTAPGGQPVRGYVNADKILERVRTSYEAPGQGTVDLEAIFLDWGDFKGVKFPRLLIQHQNQQLARVLVVADVTAQPAANNTARK